MEIPAVVKAALKFLVALVVVAVVGAAYLFYRAMRPLPARSPCPA